MEKGAVYFFPVLTGLGCPDHKPLGRYLPSICRYLGL